MNVVRYNPGNLFGLRSNINSLFDDFFTPSRNETSFSFPVDIYEEEESLVVVAQIPGMEKEDINIEIKDGVLYLAGEYKQSEDIKSESYHIKERTIGKISRSFSLPSSIDPDNVSASYEKGLLKLRIGKLEAVKPKKIDIK